MRHTQHYRVTINNISKIILLTKPLPECAFFKNPNGYCQENNQKIKARVHYDNIRTEYYFRNYSDAVRYFNYLQKTEPKNYSFFNVFAWQPTPTII